MKLQIALDDVTLEGALELVKKVRDYIDIIEIGTPFVYEYGMQAVRTMKEHFPDKEILADMKIMDAGYYEGKTGYYYNWRTRTNITIKQKTSFFIWNKGI